MTCCPCQTDTTSTPPTTWSGLEIDGATIVSSTFTGGTISGSSVTDLPAPVESDDAATKGYVDGIVVLNVATIADLRAVDISGFVSGRSVFVRGYYASGDGGGGNFYYSSSSVLTDDGGAVIRPAFGSGRWLRIHDGTVSVRWFGAKGDYVNDDTTSISNAFSASLNKGSVYFPSGTYGITTIQTDKSLRLVGDGMSVSIIKRLATDSATQSDLLFFTAGSNAIDSVIIENLGFDHVWNASDGSTYSCVNVYQANNVYTRGCYFTRAQYHGLKLTACLNSLVDGCSFYHCQYDGIGIGGPGGLPLNRRAKYTTVTNCSFEDTFGGVIMQVGCDFCTVSSNQFKKSGIQFGQDCTNVNITDNNVNGQATYGAAVSYGGAATGIFVEGCTDILISDNNVQGITTAVGNKYGIWVDGSEVLVNSVLTQCPIIRCTISDNVISNVTNSAVLVTAKSEDGTIYGTNVKIADNNISGTGQGITVTGTDGLDISSNFVNTPQFTAVTVSGCLHSAIDGNTILNPSTSFSNSYYGVIIDGPSSDVAITDNIILDNRATKLMRFGIFDSTLNGGSASLVRSSGNIISGAVTHIAYFPEPKIPTLGTWSLGDVIQGFQGIDASTLATPAFWTCVVAGAPGTWRASSQPFYAMAYLAGDLATTNGVEAAVAFSAAWTNDLAIWSGGNPTRLTVPAGAKKVRVTAGIRWAADGSGTGYRSVKIKSNNGAGTYPLNTTWAADQKPADTVAAVSGSCAIMTGIIDVANIQYFTVTAEQTSGGALNIVGNAGAFPSAGGGTFFQMEVIQ